MNPKRTSVMCQPYFFVPVFTKTLLSFVQSVFSRQGIDLSVFGNEERWILNYGSDSAPLSNNATPFSTVSIT